MTNRYDAVAVRRYKDNQGNDKAQFTTIGVAFPMKDKDGFTVRLNAVPAPTDGEFVILLMPPKARDDNRASGQRRGGTMTAHNGETYDRQDVMDHVRGSSRDLDDDIPF